MIKRIRKPGLLISALLVFFSCTNENKKRTEQADLQKTNVSLFETLPSGKTRINFVNTFHETDSENYFSYEYIYNGAGVAAGDINNDGLTDIYFAANQTSCKLYLNKGNLVFEDITKKSGVETNGWCTGVTMADVNADGWLDIYVCRSSKFKKPEERKNLLFINSGNGTFREQAHEFGIDNDGYSTQATFFDADNDNDLDMFLVNHGVEYDFLINKRKEDYDESDFFVTSRFYLNNNNTSFTDHSKEARVLNYGFGLSAAVADINADGFPDIYVCNDYHMPDFLFINNGNATFTESIEKYMKHISQFSMGSDFADFNNDGLMDLITLDMLPEDMRRQKMLFTSMNHDLYYLFFKYGSNQQRMHNCLQLNNGNGTFSDIAMLAGVYRTDWSWAPLFADFDNDGWKDLLITNGYYRDVTNSDFTVYMAEQMRKNGGKQDKSLNMIDSIPTTPITNYVYKNNGDLTFADKTYEWGLDQKTFSNGACYADLDNDGDLEIIINNLGDSALVYENKSNEINHSNFLKIKLTGPAGNTNGIGAVITVYTGGNIQVQQMFPSRGYMSACDNRLNFGLGNYPAADSVEIKWQGGKIQRMKDVKANQLLTFNYKNAAAVSAIAKQSGTNLFFEKASAKQQINFSHTENEFIDFKREPLLPHEFSKGGPYITTGDVNGDNAEDFFIGNAKGSSGKMFIQKSGGVFIENSSQPWEQDKMHEDMGCLLFDSDNDKDLDLYVVSGGSEENTYSDYYQDRLYINDGKGNFKKCNDCLPKINSSGSCVVAADYDGDGDSDLFRGGLVLPSVYPMPATSYLLQNHNGKFTDVVTTVAPELKYAGMIKDAVWCDFNNDSKTDLVICGEWIPIMMFQNNGNKFDLINKNQNGALTAGWWNKIVASDFDRDGDIDFVAGNYGLNAKLKASPQKPLMIVAKDFDGNQTMDAVICNYEMDGKSYPIYSRDVMTDQVRPLKKKLLKYADYYDKTIDQVFPVDSLRKATVLTAYNLASCYIENTGNGNLLLHPLPVEAQFAPVCGIVVDDFNKDGINDLLLAGNSLAESVDLGLCDAGTGLLLLGDGKGKFKPVLSRTSGFDADKDVRNIVMLHITHGKKLILVGNNNSKAEVFSVK